MLGVAYAECRNLAHYAACRYAECRYAECRGAKPLILALIFMHKSGRIQNTSFSQ
jgi:hypothetical protein